MTHQNHSKCLVFGQKSWTDPPKPLKMLGFRSIVMGNHSPKPLKMLGFRPKVMGNDPPKPFKILGFRSKVMGNDPPKPMLLRKGSVSTAIKLSNTLVTKERAARARSRSECRWGSSVRPSPKNVLHAPCWFPERARMGEQRPSPKNELHAARAGFRSERVRGSGVRHSPRNVLHGRPRSLRTLLQPA